MNNEQLKQFFHNGIHLPKIDITRKSNFVLDEEFGFYSEENFQRMLETERKRTERSQKPFLLVIIDFGDLLDSGASRKHMRDLSSFIEKSVRDIDIKGWYNSRRKIGIVYTEISLTGKDPILQKIHSNLEIVFGRELVESIEVSYGLFPEERDGHSDGNGRIADARFYPLPYQYQPVKRLPLLMKRCLDVVGSIFLILLFSPFFVIIPFLIKSTSKGPVFFTQTRIGLRGKTFTFVKFRSMRVGNDSAIHRDFVKKLIQGESGVAAASGKGIYKIVNDPRVTGVGKFLRKTSLDEIPQFFNVLWGDMSLVGPRPPIPYELENYHSWHKRRVLEAKPGITGFWQVNGRSSTAFDTMVRMDLHYVRKWSVLGDIMLILQTPFALFKGGY